MGMLILLLVTESINRHFYVNWRLEFGISLTPTEVGGCNVINKHAIINNS